MISFTEIKNKQKCIYWLLTDICSNSMRTWTGYTIKIVIAVGEEVGF